MSPRFACHQRLRSSGVVNALNTRWRGASNSRVIRICSSVGSVSFALPLLVAAIVLLLAFEFVEYEVEFVEAVRPRLLVRLHPVVDRLERTTVQPVQPLPSVVADGNRPDLSQHAQVLRHLRLR